MLVGSVDGISRIKSAKVVRGEVGVEVCDSIGLDVDRGVGSEVGSADGINFGLNDISEMGYSEVFFNCLNDGKSVVSFLDKSIETNNGTLLEISDIYKNNNAEVRRGVGRDVGIRVGSHVGGEYESGDDWEVGLEVVGEFCFWYGTTP